MLSVTAATATQAQTPTTKTTMATTTATAATEKGRKEVRGREGEMKYGRRGGQAHRTSKCHKSVSSSTNNSTKSDS